MRVGRGGPLWATPDFAMNCQVQWVTELFEGSVQKRQLPRCAATSVGPTGHAIPSFPACQHECLPIEIVESESEYKIVMPLSGIDRRKTYLFATSHSLLIEIRFKTSIRHQVNKSMVAESIDRRISREFTFPTEIEHGSTTVQICGESIQITARKSRHNQDASWSQLIEFDGDRV